MSYVHSPKAMLRFSVDSAPDLSARKCMELHKTIQIFLTHEVASLDDLKHGRAEPIPVKEPPTKKCLDHEKSLKIYCYDCDSLICQHCTVKDHRDHNFEFTKKAAPGEKMKLLEEVKPFERCACKAHKHCGTHSDHQVGG